MPTNVKEMRLLKDENIKTLYDFKRWIKDNIDYEDDIDETRLSAIIDIITEQVEQSGKEGTGKFIFKIKKLKERK